MEALLVILESLQASPLVFLFFAHEDYVVHFLPVALHLFLLLLHLHFIPLHLALLLDEVFHGLSQADLVVQTGRLDYYGVAGGRNRYALGELGEVLCEVQVSTVRRLFGLRSFIFYLGLLGLEVFHWDGRRVLKDDELVDVGPLHDPLLLHLVHAPARTGLMHLHLAPSDLLPIDHSLHIHLQLAARKLKHLPIAIGGVLGYRLLAVVATVAHLSNGKVLRAPFAFENVEVGPDLPIDFFPGDPVGLSHEGDELLQVPLLVNHMLPPQLPMEVDELLPLQTSQLLPLVLREQTIAVTALVEVVFVFFQ
eukprot:CAMPEP_0170547374 /NCGR_PEP_ID=MMETSP0211-20121228/5766_1 /TAXON_ID=311385 /ORGANISM="Pseudokeronopsis sp., Strain OXSARD2" /LENGTH=307 /DNA_ID=CAMNT_0010852385 /DNA_START=952 /DNA_END=1875 /DNA_ORIENTATION=-